MAKLDTVEGTEMSGQELKVGIRVIVNVPDKPELTGEGFVVTELHPGDGRRLFQVDMGDHDNWFPADWLRPLETGEQR